MRCPSCHVEETRVIDTRVIDDGATIRRRRECEKCQFRFSTTEDIEILTLMVEKVDGTKESYNQDKLVKGIKTALQKRAISAKRLKSTIHKIEQDIQTKSKNDTITTRTIGEIVMKQLKKLDKVAYIRFASVYRSFEDLSEFADELQKFKGTKKRSSKLKSNKKS